jgi:hypothetical protein
MKMTEMDKVMIAFHESLTAPDKEDWSIIPAGEEIHLTAVQEGLDRAGQRRVWLQYNQLPLAELKRVVNHLPKKHNLGCVTIIMCKDNADNGGNTLLAWLNGKAKKKNFSLTSMFGPASTAEAISVMQSRFNNTPPEAA